MRFSTLFGKTLREPPAGTELVSRQLAQRAALLRSTSAGDVYLPLGWRARERLLNVLRAELDAAGGQEISVSGLSADALIAELCRRDIISYRDLPKVFYSVGATARGYALQADFDTLRAACARAFAICDLKPLEIEADSGIDFVLTHEKGPDSFLQCDTCGYAATAGAAEFNLDPCADADATSLPLEKVATPNCNTIAALATFLNLPKCRTLKALMYIYDEREFVFVVVRGDLDVSEQKVLRLLGGGPLRPAADAEIADAGAVPGYASPRGLHIAPSPADRSQTFVTVIADQSIHTSANYAAGANEAGYHFVNLNYLRDFKATLVANVALPLDGLHCGDCKTGLLRETKAFRLGGCRQWDSAATALSPEGNRQPLTAATSEMDVDGLLAAIIETHHDQAGILWPETIAPFHYHLIKLGKAPETATAADQLYAELLMKGKRVLYDDRDESAGVKFADADLLGMPVRVTVSDKSLKAGGAEVKRRNGADKEIVALDAIA
jgi:prolyl-tRNA synthetase